MGLIARIEKAKAQRVAIETPQGEPTLLVVLHREGAPLGQPINTRRGFPVRVTGGRSA